MLLFIKLFLVHQATAPGGSRADASADGYRPSTRVYSPKTLYNIQHILYMIHMHNIPCDIVDAYYIRTCVRRRFYTLSIMDDNTCRPGTARQNNLDIIF
jgi:hypothetical protein